MYKKVKFKYAVARRVIADHHFVEVAGKSERELAKTPSRSDVINFLLQSLQKNELRYLEIGVRKPDENFDKIRATHKHGVDPGVEFEMNPVEFKMTSDEFFEKWRKGELIGPGTRFDVIFVDGLHTAEQTDRDITHSLEAISDEGYVIMHDCNPPTEFHAREKYDFWSSPALDHWNGTTWKAFFKHRKRQDVYSCCVDTDWGIGIFSKKTNLGKATTITNEFYEYAILDANRKDCLNLVSFEELKAMVQGQ